MQRLLPQNTAANISLCTSWLQMTDSNHFSSVVSLEIALEIAEQDTHEQGRLAPCIVSSTLRRITSERQ